MAVTVRRRPFDARGEPRLHRFGSRDPSAARLFYALGVGRLLKALAARIVEPFDPVRRRRTPWPDATSAADAPARQTVAFALRSWSGSCAPNLAAAAASACVDLGADAQLAVRWRDPSVPRAGGKRGMTVFGGVRYGADPQAGRGVDVVATPAPRGPHQQGALKLDAVGRRAGRADLWRMGFLPPVTRVLEAVPDGQRMLFSATLTAMSRRW